MNIMETENIKKASEFAKKKHNMPSDCQRYGNMPYSVHLESVVKNAEKYIYYIKDEDREDILISCWSHDLLEDTDTSPRILEKTFNRRIAEIVFAVTNESGYSLGRYNK